MACKAHSSPQCLLSPLSHFPLFFSPSFYFFLFLTCCPLAYPILSLTLFFPPLFLLSYFSTSHFSFLPFHPSLLSFFSHSPFFFSSLPTLFLLPLSSLLPLYFLLFFTLFFPFLPPLLSYFTCFFSSSFPCFFSSSFPSSFFHYLPFFHVLFLFSASYSPFLPVVFSLSFLLSLCILFLFLFLSFHFNSCLSVSSLPPLFYLFPSLPLSPYLPP